MKYVKKPIVVEAFELGKDYVPDWFFNKVWTNEIITYAEPGVWGTSSCSIKTLEGVMTAKKGDMIIKGVKGEIYPCKKDIFYASYEPYNE